MNTEQLVEQPLQTYEFLEQTDSVFQQEHRYYLQVSEKSWEEVREDLQFAPSMKIAQLTPPISCPVQMHYIVSPSEEYALIAANYYIKYWREQVQKLPNKSKSDVYRNHFAKQEQSAFTESYIPIVNATEYVSAYGEPKIIGKEEPEMMSPPNLGKFVPYQKPLDDWFMPYEIIIILLDEFKVDEWQQILPGVRQNLIFINGMSQKAERQYAELNFLKPMSKQEISKVDDSYLEQLFFKIIANAQYECAPTLQFEYVLDCLREFKGTDFNPVSDTMYLARALVRRAYDLRVEVITLDLIEQALNLKHTSSSMYPLTAADKIDDLIGLTSAKETLEKIVKRIQFNKQRITDGLQSIDSRFVLAFIGNPGTAKTTFAKLMAQHLNEMGLLSYNKVKIATKQDLIGEYVGQTTPKIEKLFKEYKGGMIFIDEAYSLHEAGKEKGYAHEAMAELVFQIEENPETLVVFAGYPKEMEQFLQTSNSGLQSRITHTVHFDDYTPREMADIFHMFVHENQFILEDEQKMKDIICSFCARYTPDEFKRAGNGRLMRNLFDRTLEEKISSSPEDLVITIDYLQKAADQLAREKQTI